MSPPVTAYLFHADAIADALRSKPGSAYVKWLRKLPREDQFTSAVSMADLYLSADRSSEPDRQRRLIEERVVPAVTVLPFDVAVARKFSEIRSSPDPAGDLSTRELQVAATALHHGLQLVTARSGRFRRVPGLSVRSLPRRSGST